MKIIFCVPGKTFSRWFLYAWTNLIKELEKVGIEWELAVSYSAIVHHARDQLVQQIFKNRKDYNYMMWIDSDIYFEPHQFFKLLDHNVDIVSGLYFRELGITDRNKKRFACIVNGKAINEIELNEIKPSLQHPKLKEVDGNGMGWMLVKKGVFEILYENGKFPWFSEKYLSKFGAWKALIEDGAFQENARDNGFKSYVDPTIIVGHEKPIVLHEKTVDNIR